MNVTRMVATASRTTRPAVWAGCLGLLLALSASGSGSAIAAAGQRSAAAAALPKVEVYKDPSCGCCALWVKHMEQAGFTVSVVNTPDMAAVHAKHRVSGPLQSCHTALVGGFIVEGHVPADDVKRLLRERPKVLGVTVPGMPIGSPGMEQGGVKQAYKVLTFDSAGKTTVFSSR